MNASEQTAPLVLGVDGGGTKTAFSICDAHGRELFSARTGSTSPKAVSPDKARANMRNGCEQLKQAGAPVEAVGQAVYGLGGLDLPEERPFFEQMVADAGLPCGAQAHIVNDGLLPLYAMGERAGTVIVAGTGSIAFHVGEKGDVTRVGGWGYGISDLGSGNWVGAEAVRQALLMHDGAVRRDALLDDVLAALDLGSSAELTRWAAEDHDGSTLARLARPVMDGASAAARRIKDQTADHLAALYQGIVSQSPDAARGVAVLSGGLFSSRGLVDMLAVRLQRIAGRSGGAVEVRTMDRPPVAGATALALMLLADPHAPVGEYPPLPA